MFFLNSTRLSLELPSLSICLIVCCLSGQVYSLEGKLLESLEDPFACLLGPLRTHDFLQLCHLASPGVAGRGGTKQLEEVGTGWDGLSSAMGGILLETPSCEKPPMEGTSETI